MNKRCRTCRTSIQVLNPPLMFVIDTTKSEKPDKDSIFNLTGKVVESITNKRVNIPRYKVESTSPGKK